MAWVMFEFALGEFLFTFTVAHFLSLIFAALGIVVLTYLVNYFLNDPFGAISVGTVGFIVLAIVLLFMGVFDTLEADLARTAAVAMAGITIPALPALPALPELPQLF